MTSEHPVQKSSRRIFQLDVSRSPSTARVAITICLVIFVAAGFVACNCPGFFVVMAICSVVAFWAGTRTQRVIAAILFVLAITGAIFQFRAEFQDKQRLQERIRRVNEAKKVPEKSK
jgi:cell division protein FtsW (lipid II flippase)